MKPTQDLNEPCRGHDGPCENPGKWQRQNTQYVEDRNNWVWMCDECLRFRNEAWDELWEDYYRSRL